MWFSFLEDLENKTPKKETPAPVMNNSCSVGHSARILREKGILESSIEIDHGWSLCFSSFVFFFALKKKVYNNPKIIKLSTQWGDFFFFFCHWHELTGQLGCLYWQQSRHLNRRIDGDSHFFKKCCWCASCTQFLPQK